MWDHKSIEISKHNTFLFTPRKKYPVVMGFAEKIVLKKWVNAFSADDVKCVNFVHKLSEVYKLTEQAKKTNTIKTWRYELVAQ